jgi:apolipoprotein N-acyltransferase
MRRFVSLWPAALSAVLLLAAFPPVNLGLLVIIALAPFLAALMKGSGKRALALGYLFGFIYMIAQMQWLQTLVVKWTASTGLAVLVWVLCGFLGAWYFALFGWLANRCFQRAWPWLVPIVWAGIEVFRSYIPGLGFPWGLAANPLFTYPPLMGAAYFGSIYLVSAWCALGGLLVAMFLGGDGWPKIRSYAIAFVLIIGLSMLRWATPIAGRKMVVVAGQLGVDMAFGNPNEQEVQVGKSADNLIEAARMQNAQLLVLPEGISDGSESFPPQTSFHIDPNVPIIFGGQRGLRPTYQSVFGYDGKKWGYADKTRLVIFGEYVPFRNFPIIRNFHLASGDLTPGEKLSTLDIRGRKVGPLVCFEAMFPDCAYRQALNGSQLLTVSEIDDWYMGTAAPQQLMSESVWRAVETDLPLIRAASTGYSIAVDQRGRMINKAPLKVAIPLHAEFAVSDSPHPFPLFPVFPITSLGSLFVAFLLPWIPRKKANL